MICDKCGWIGEKKELKQVTKSEVWGCPKCEGIFFTLGDANCTKDDEVKE